MLLNICQTLYLFEDTTETFQCGRQDLRLQLYPDFVSLLFHSPPSTSHYKIVGASQTSRVLFTLCFCTPFSLSRLPFSTLLHSPFWDQVSSPLGHLLEISSPFYIVSFLHQNSYYLILSGYTRLLKLPVHLHLFSTKQKAPTGCHLFL